MDNKRSQHFNYTFESLPTIFHSQTKNFFTYLEKDGLKFLEFWWDHMGVRLGQEESDPFEDISYEIKEIPEKKSRMVLLKLPEPKNFYECYFMAFLEEPLKRWPVRLPNTRVFVLEYVPMKISATGTSFGEITRSARYIRYEDGPQPELNIFYQKILSYVWKKGLGAK
jgi:hypothetical protein